MNKNGPRSTINFPIQATAARSSGAFSSNATYAVGSEPTFILPADVNADSNTDLVVVNNTGNSSLSILLNLSYAPTFVGSGAGLTGLNGASITGTVHATALVVSNTTQYAAQLQGSSTIGTWLQMQNYSAGGRSWNFVSTGSGNSEGAGKLLFIDNTANAVRMTISTNGNVGIGTTTPAATLDVGGSFRVNSGTTYGRMQSGIFTAGTNGTSFKIVTNAFPTAFSTIPGLVATAINDTNFNDVADTFSVSIRRLTTTNFILNIQRVDTNALWGQSLRINWHAWE